MADNVQITEGTGTAVHADEFTHSVFGAGKTQIVKLDIGAAGSGTALSGGAGNVDAGTVRTTQGADSPMMATLGAISGAAVITDANGTLQQYLRGLVTLQLLTNSYLDGVETKLDTLAGINAQFPATPSAFPIVTITRPANTTAYTAGDVVGGVITIPTGLTSGQNGAFIYAYLLPQIAAIPSGMTSFRLYLYDVTPVSAIADNGVWTFTSTDWAAFLGYIDLGSPVDLGSGLLVQTPVSNQPFKLNGSANLFAYLVTNGAFTPAGNSEVYTLRPGLVGI